MKMMDLVLLLGIVKILTIIAGKKKEELGGYQILPLKTVKEQKVYIN